MNNNGYIRLSRRIREWTWYKNLNTHAVFLHILLGASWENETVRGVNLKRGQFAATVPELASENQLTVQQVKTALAHLKSTEDITVEARPKISIITVKNYDLLVDGNSIDNPISTDTSNGNQPDNAQDINLSTLLNKNTRIEEAEEARVRAGAAAAAAPEKLVSFVVGKYNEICSSLPKIQADIAVKHKAELIAKAKQIMGTATFEQLFRLVEQSDFLTRRSSNSGFRADFEWIMKPDNLVKILSGAYSENYSKTEKKNSAVPSAADYNEPLYD